MRQPPLERAREALARGDLRGAVNHGWTAAIAAARERDPERLAEARAFAGELEAHVDERLASEVQGIAVYCSTALEQARTGVHDRSPFARLLTRDRPTPVKICPDCAEAVQPAARICRYCGHEFSPPGGEGGGP